MGAYLDHASVSPLRPEVAAALHEVLAVAQADPGRPYSEALVVRSLIEDARDEVAGLASVTSRQVVFTSSIAESINTAMASLAQGGQVQLQFELPGQQPAGVLKKQFRHDAIALIFQDDPTPYFSQLRDLYPREQITAFVKSPVSAPFEVKTHDELFLTDYRFKLVVDFTNNPKIHDHFNRLSALQISSFKTPEEFIAHARR